MTGGDTKKLNKMMEEGKLDPNELLPKMAKYMEEMANQNQAYAKALNTSRVAQGRFNWQWEQTVKLFAKSGFDAGMKTFFDTLSTGLAENEEFVKRFGAAFEWGMGQLKKFGDFAGLIIKKIVAFGESIGLTKEQMIILTGVVGGLLLPFTRVFTLLGLVAVAIEDIYAYTQGRGSLFGEWFEGLTPETKQSLSELGQSLSKMAKSLGDLAAMSLSGLKDLWELFQDSGGLKATADAIKAIADAITSLSESIQGLPETEFVKNLVNITASRMQDTPERWKSQEFQENYARGVDYMKASGAVYHASSEKMKIEVNGISVTVNGVSIDEVGAADFVERFDKNLQKAVQMAAEAAKKGEDFQQQVQRVGMNMQDVGG